MHAVYGYEAFLSSLSSPPPVFSLLPSSYQKHFAFFCLSRPRSRLSSSLALYKKTGLHLFCNALRFTSLQKESRRLTAVAAQSLRIACEALETVRAASAAVSPALADAKEQPGCEVLRTSDPEGEGQGRGQVSSRKVPGGGVRLPSAAFSVKCALQSSRTARADSATRRVTSLSVPARREQSAAAKAPHCSNKRNGGEASAASFTGPTKRTKSSRSGRCTRYSHEEYADLSSKKSCRHSRQKLSTDAFPSRLNARRQHTNHKSEPLMCWRRCRVSRREPAETL